MDIAKLAKDIGTLQYETDYRFEFGAPCYQALREADIRGILIALRDRGFTIARDNEAHVASPPICAEESHDQQTAA